MSAQKYIVSEVTTNWKNGQQNSELISEKFEKVIAVNAVRGYKLKEWKYAQVANEIMISETIIAIFEFTGIKMNNKNSA